jgi:hypothetical protein
MASGRWLVWLMKERGVALEGGRHSFLIADGVRVLQEPADDGERERGQLARRVCVGAVCSEAALDGRQPVAHGFAQELGVRAVRRLCERV